MPPDGIASIKDMQAFHDSHSGQWLETPPVNEPWYAKQWLLRQKDLVETYQPDYIYLDNQVMPLGDTGLEAVAHFYNTNLKHNGTLEAVVTTNALSDEQARGVTAPSSAASPTACGQVRGKPRPASASGITTAHLRQ
ncbi:MAG: hypothetical protein WDN06_13275 [Asticcacaulis sp.]